MARVDFVDRVLGDELLNIVEEWVKGLKESTVQKSNAMMFLKRHKAKFATLSNLITNIVFMISSVLLTGKFVLKMGFSSMAEITTTQLVHIIYSVFCCVVIWILSSKMSGFISDQLFERLKMYGKSTKLQIGGHYILSNR